MEALTLEALMRSWIAGPLPESYRETVETVLIGLRAGAPETDATEACVQLAMLFGDSGAPELCVVVCYRGIALSEALGPEREEALTTRFLSHAMLAMADLGLARFVEDGASAAKKAGPGAQPEAPPETLAVDEDGAAAWIRDFLAPLGGSLETGTQFAARLAAIRAGVLPVPDPLTLDAVSSLATS